jgi:hypothetical protein
MTDSKEAQRPEPTPIDPEIASISRLNDLHFRIWRLSGDVSHGNESLATELEARIAERSATVLDVIRMRSGLKRILLETTEDSVRLSWDSLRIDDPHRVSRSYLISELEKVEPKVRQILKPKDTTPTS